MTGNATPERLDSNMPGRKTLLITAKGACEAFHGGHTTGRPVGSVNG